MGAGRIVKRAAIIGVALAAVGVAVAAPMVGNMSNSAEVPVALPPPVPKVVPQVAAKPQEGDTPMLERVATLGILNKRNGLSRDLQMKPGQAVRIGDLVVRLKACEETADWEADHMTGAFVQVLVKKPLGDMWSKVFSGWLFKESPSLNVVQHPVYDVWAKACKMRHAEVGPDTVTVSDGERSGSSRSSAPKSPEADAADPAPPPTAPPSAPTATSSNSI